MRLLLGISENGDVAVDLDPTVNVGSLARSLALSGGWPSRSVEESTLSLAVERSGAVLDPEQPVGRVDLRSGDLVDITRVTPEMPLEGAAEEHHEPEASLRILSGPLAGNVFRLTTPACTIGRSADNDVVLLDPSVSRRHATFVVETDGVVVTDLGSTNGIHVAGRPAIGPTPVTSGKRILIGRSWAVVDHSSGPIRPVEGRISVTPTVRPSPYVPLTIDVPAPPERSTANRILSRGGREPQLPNDYREELDASVQKLELAQARERAARLEESPSFGAVLDGVRSRSRIWERQLTDTDGLTVRLGLAEMPSATKVTVADGGEPSLRSFAERVPRHFELIDGVPVTVDFGGTGGVVLRGAAAHTHPLAASLVGQLVGLKPPKDLGVLLLGRPADGPSTWDWLKWTAHVDLTGSGTATVGDESARVLTELLDGATELAPDGRGSRQDRPSSVLVVVDGEPPAEHRIILERLAVEGRNRGLYTLMLAGPKIGPLPSAMGSWPAVAVGDRLGRLAVPFGHNVDPIALETCTRHESRALGRALASLATENKTVESEEAEIHPGSGDSSGTGIRVAPLLLARSGLEPESVTGEETAAEVAAPVADAGLDTDLSAADVSDIEVSDTEVSSIEVSDTEVSETGASQGEALTAEDAESPEAVSATGVSPAIELATRESESVETLSADPVVEDPASVPAALAVSGDAPTEVHPRPQSAAPSAFFPDASSDPQEQRSDALPELPEVEDPVLERAPSRQASGPLIPDADSLGIPPVPPAVVNTSGNGSPAAPPAAPAQSPATPAQAPAAPPSVLFPHIDPPPPEAPSGSGPDSGLGVFEPQAGALAQDPVPVVLPEFIDLLSLPRSGDQFRLVLGVVQGRSKSASFAFNPGRDGSLAIVGPKGSGKSTCLRTIAAATTRMDRSPSAYPLVYQLGADAELAPVAALPTALGATGDADAITAALSELESLLDERLNTTANGSIEDGPGFRPVVVLVDDVNDFMRRLEPMAPGRLRQVLGRLLQEGAGQAIHVVLSADSAADLDPWLAASLGRWIPLDPSKPGTGSIGETIVRFAALEAEFTDALPAMFESLGEAVGALRP